MVVSVFVNPTQFNDKNDLRNYPRTPEADERLLAEAGADFVLMPSVEEIYPSPIPASRFRAGGQGHGGSQRARDTSTAWLRS